MRHARLLQGVGCGRSGLRRSVSYSSCYRRTRLARVARQCPLIPGTSMNCRQPHGLSRARDAVGTHMRDLSLLFCSVYNGSVDRSTSKSRIESFAHSQRLAKPGTPLHALPLKLIVQHSKVCTPYKLDSPGASVCAGLLGICSSLFG